MFFSLLAKIKKLFLSVDSKNEVNKMTNRWSVQNVSPVAFDKSKKICTIKRIGKRFVINDFESNTVIPVSQESVKAIGTKISEEVCTVKIEVSGLSKAQVGRLVNDLKTESGKTVLVKKIQPREHGRMNAKYYYHQRVNLPSTNSVNRTHGLSKIPIANGYEILFVGE